MEDKLSKLAAIFIKRNEQIYLRRKHFEKIQKKRMKEK